MTRDSLLRVALELGAMMIPLAGVFGGTKRRTGSRLPSPECDDCFCCPQGCEHRDGEPLRFDRLNEWADHMRNEHGVEGPL